MLVGDADQRGFAQGMAFALVFLFYLAPRCFGMQLAAQRRRGEAVAASSRSSRPRSRCASCSPARCSATPALAVVQMVLYAAVGLVGLSFTSYESYLPSVTGP